MGLEVIVGAHGWEWVCGTIVQYHGVGCESENQIGSEIGPGR